VSQHRDPPRLLDPGSPADPRLRDMLQAAHTTLPSAAQLEGLARKVSVAVTPPAGALGQFSTVSALKLSGILLAASALVWLGWRAQHANDLPPSAAPARGQTPTDRAPSMSEAPVRVAPASQRGTSTVVPNPAPPAEVPPPSARVPARVKRSRARSAPSALAWPVPKVSTAHSVNSAAPSEPARPLSAPTAPSKPAAAKAMAPELDLLSRAQRLLARDPAAALEVIDEHARAYPAGEFVEEREALAIDALRRLGRRQEAQARAQGFLLRYPASPHRERIESWLR
jgi:hypothetical protein